MTTLEIFLTVLLVAVTSALAWAIIQLNNISKIVVDVVLDSGSGGRGGAVTGPIILPPVTPAR